MLAARDLARRAGLEIKPSNLASRADLRLQHYLKLADVDLILDVGANRGQFAASVFAGGYRGRILSFEALPDVYDELRRRARTWGERWTVAPAYALSNRTGRAPFNITTGDASSSLLPPSRYLQRKSATLQPAALIEVETRKLDDVLAELTPAPATTFLKIDVQGGEGKVLEGARETLAAAAGVLVEVSCLALYDGQALAHDIEQRLREAGFAFWDLSPVLRCPHTARLEQFDVVYMRQSLCSQVL